MITTSSMKKQQQDNTSQNKYKTQHKLNEMRNNKHTDTRATQNNTKNTQNV